MGEQPTLGAGVCVCRIPRQKLLHYRAMLAAKWRGECLMQRRTALFTLFLLGPVPWLGCHRPSVVTIDRLVIGEVMMDSELSENLRALCMPGGRLNGTDNGHRAEAFVAEKLRQYGLENVHFEPFDMPGWRVNETEVSTLTDPPLMLKNAVALGNTRSTPPDGVTAELIDVGEGTDGEVAASGIGLPATWPWCAAARAHAGHRWSDCVNLEFWGHCLSAVRAVIR